MLYDQIRAKTTVDCRFLLLLLLLLFFVQVTVAVTLKLLGRTFSLPLNLSNLQVKAHPRIIAKPLLSDYPFAGALSMSLMDTPHVDFDLPVNIMGT